MGIFLGLAQFNKITVILDIWMLHYNVITHLKSKLIKQLLLLIYLLISLIDYSNRFLGSFIYSETVYSLPFIMPGEPSIHVSNATIHMGAVYRNREHSRKNYITKYPLKIIRIF